MTKAAPISCTANNVLPIMRLYVHLDEKSANRTCGSREPYWLKNIARMTPDNGKYQASIIQIERMMQINARVAAMPSHFRMSVVPACRLLVSMSDAA
jgi:hypothetical protein